ncbi:hypothetical protein THRCLA_21583 [Thraustotheca clavata]|uniref:RGS domain-containing protein n=1 Tax=Thraustotheca clavata TaxID=74557 RepID=A0A1V9ZV45_9STRA|nr:hypothetical protein THRCLA_21583 [Thraustotheca clavata]
MGSFPSSGKAPTESDSVEKPVFHRIGTKKLPPPPDYATDIGTICYKYLHSLPLPLLLESTIGRRQFALYCAEIKKENILQLYFALQCKWQKLKEPAFNIDDTLNLPALDIALQAIASTTRLSNSTIALLRIGLNNGGAFTNENEISSMMDEMIKTMKAVEWEHWPRSSQGREFMGKTIKFEPLLNDDIAMCFFHQFLVQEYSSENLEFLDSVNGFEADYDYKPEKNLENAQRILRLFVDENAPLQINIPSKIRVRLERKITKDHDVPKDVFRLAKAEIVALVQRDSWPRYLKTPSWAAYLDYKPVDEEVSRTGSAKLRHDIYLEFIGNDDLHTILTSELGREYLQLFVGLLESRPEGSVEFLYHASTFANITNEKERDEMKHDIFSRFLAAEADTPAIRVDPRTATEIQKLVESSQSPQIFQPAVEETTKYLQSEILPLFKKNGIYAKYRILVGQTSNLASSAPRRGSMVKVV